MKPGEGGIIELFARHPTAANLLMLVMLVAGLLAIERNNAQFFPDFEVERILVQVAWPGTSAGDVDNNIVDALEPELRVIDDVKTVTGVAREGLGQIFLEFNPGADMQAGLAAAENAVAQATTLPEGAEQPVISSLRFSDTVSRIVIWGDYPESVLKANAKLLRETLLARGVDRVTLLGARSEEIHVDAAPMALLALDLTPGDIARTIARSSRNEPTGGTAGVSERQIRSLGLHTDAAGLAELEVRAGAGGDRVLLGDVAQVRDAFADDEPTLMMGALPAIELYVQRAAGNDALEVAAIVDTVVAEFAPTLPPGVLMETYDTEASSIEARINLLMRNGLGGLVLVVGILFVFLSSRVAMWVAVGIPVAVMATFAVMLAVGETINMISLFAIIMMLGIIVDDAIVVGEHAMARRLAGATGLEAAIGGARRMLAPVSCAALTTIAVFLPLAMLSGELGQIIFALPVVAVAALTASLIECFLVLPHHMRGALAPDPRKASPPRRAFNARFDRFRDNHFRRAAALVLRWRYTTVAAAVAALIVSLGVIASGRLQFVFFPSPERDAVLADFAFAPGSPRDHSVAMAAELERALREADDALTGDGESVVHLAVSKIGMSVAGQSRVIGIAGANNHIGGVQAELKQSGERDVRTAALIAGWRERVRPLPGIESLTITERRAGPPGRDVDVRLTGGSVEVLKAAALDVRDTLSRYAGVSDISDNLPWGKHETVLEVTPRGRVMGFTTESVARQVRDAFDGAIAHRFARGDEEVAVRVRFEAGATGMEGLHEFRLRSENGGEVPLPHVVSLGEKRGFAVIRRVDGAREVAVTAEVDAAVTNPTELTMALAMNEMPAIAARHGVDFRFAGKAEEQQEALSGMGLGTMIGFSAIYMILAWVFASYTRPLVVMAIIPFGLIGSVVGHLLMGFDLTILSIIGLVGLSGIVVNDSIILVSTIDERLASGESVYEAITQGACDRLRAVILTSLATIGGLLPLLAETDQQAQFLKPMALTFVFGLMVTTLLVLFVIPALIAIQHDFRRRPSRLPEARQEQHQDSKELKPAE